ncbi:MAG: hypothetical protein WC273_07710 [Dehalococcoidia bacterium]
MLDAALSGLIIACKYALPVLLVPFPFAAGWANFVLDSVDGDLLIPLGVKDPTYQLIDKSADWVTYVFMVIAAWRAGWPMRRAVAGLFVFRSVGQALFFLTRNELMFFLFPNFLEPLFLGYATILVFRRDRAPAFYARHTVAIWVIVVLYKMQDEFLTHVANLDRSELIARLLQR